jgi:hypothetical protein
MRFEAKKPRGLKHVQACGENLMAQEFNLSFLNIHGNILPVGKILRVDHMHKTVIRRR